MASRYPATKVLDYCLHPVRLVQDNQVLYVPCGKCNGCLLHKANKWSMRLGSEIEDNNFALFFTLTYNNHYLPTFKFLSDDHDSKFGEKIYTCYHDRNVRFNGSGHDVLRNEPFTLFHAPVSFTGVSATNYISDTPYFPYSSKRDFQLYLKLIRKDLYEKFYKGFFSEVEKEEELRFRYYAISEYGETLLRPHIHAVVLPCNSQVAEYLCYEGLYKSWQMCDKSMFAQHCHFADSGCRGYITQYLTMSSRLPQVYKDNRIKPWRLSSKGAAIGYNGYDEAEVFENVVAGIDYYYKDISRINERFILRYPKDLGNRLFPKCYEYRKKDFYGLYRIYSIFWKLRRSSRWSEYSEYFINRLSQVFNPADIQAAKTCEKFCNRFGHHPFTYVYALDMFWYKQAMSSLRQWYEWQENISDIKMAAVSYTNLYDYVSRLQSRTLDGYQLYVFDCFCAGFGYHPTDLLWFSPDQLTYTVSDDYACEVEDILTNMVKMPKFNEKFGLSPNSVY